MTVVQPNSISGINSITVAANDSLSIHKSDGTLLREIVSNTGVSTFYAIKVGAAVSVHNNGNLGITGIMTASSYVGDGSALTGIAGTEITNSDFAVGVSTFFADYSTARCGIGTIAPSKNLHIEATGHTQGILIHAGGNHSTGFDMDSNRSSAAGGLAEVNFKWNGTTVGQIGAYSGADTTNKDDGHIHFGTASAGTIAERMRITSAGLVGIGQADPEGLLHIEASSSGASYTADAADTLILERNGGCVIDFRTPAANDAGLIFSDNSARAVGTLLYNHSDNSLAFGANAAERMRIRNDGRVSIASSLAVTGVCTAAAFVPSAGQLSNRNLVINGAFQIAQRATTSTSEGYATVDRWYNATNGEDEATTQAQVTLTASDAGPWEQGFRNAYQITNGNQTGGAGAGDYSIQAQRFEAQNLANSGWDYTSGSSYVSVSFWVKSSVAQNFYGRLQTVDGTAQNYPFETGTLSANTWTKVTKKIPGHANLQFDNNNGNGLELTFVQFYGTDRTGSVSLDTWAAYASGTRTPDMTSTWWTTNDSTFAVTGVQLEVGSYATPFEHRGFGQELALCQRYYEKSYAYGTAPGTGGDNGRRLRRVCASATSQVVILEETYEVLKRTTPTVTTYATDGTSGEMSVYNYGVSTVHVSSSTYGSTEYGFEVNGSGTANCGAVFWQADAEL